MAAGLARPGPGRARGAAAVRRLAIPLAALCLVVALAGFLAWATSSRSAETGTARLSSDATQVRCGTALSSLHPAAGSTLALSRGCTYDGTLTITSDNVTVAAYGSGPLPVLTLGANGATVDVRGSGDTVKNLSLTGVAPGTWTCGGALTPAGHVDGVDIYPGAAGTTVSNIFATGFYAAVYIMAGSTGNVVENSTLTDNTELDTNSQSGSAGAFGVLLWGDHNTIRDNYINGNQACSIAYGLDGSAVEVYGGSDNLIESNRASNNSAFTELGSYAGHIATANAYTGNTVSDGVAGKGTTFLITRGSGSGAGPVDGTTASGNMVNLTRAGDQGAVSYAWRSGDGTLLTLTGNYLNLGTNQALFTDGGYVDGGGNTFIGTCNPASDC
jgi:hypothetical protein